MFESITTPLILYIKEKTDLQTSSTTIRSESSSSMKHPFVIGHNTISWLKSVLILKKVLKEFFKVIQVSDFNCKLDTPTHIIEMIKEREKIITCVF